MNRTIVLNPDYYLINDIKRTFIINKYNNHDSSVGWGSMLHPVQAMILSFFTKNKSFGVVLNELSEFLSITKEEVQDIISPFITNEEEVFVTHQEIDFRLPKNLLINGEKLLGSGDQYNPEDYICTEYDFTTKRYLKAPLNMTFMPNNVCATECIYCYADKTHNVEKPIPFNRLKEIIDEAKELKILSLNVVGGEVFTYKYWKELLGYINENNFQLSRISTKVPITKDEIRYLKNIGINEIQLSIDSLIPSEMKHILNVNDNYIKKFKETTRFFSEEGFNIQIASNLLDINCNKESMQSILDFIKEIRIDSWSIGAAFESLYKPQQSFRADKDNIYELFNYLEELNNEVDFSIRVDKTFLERGYKTFEGGSEKFEGATCSALCSHIFVLPDGKVTMCEQLYWKPNFIIGDLSHQSIQDVWNSERAQWFLNLDQKMLKKSNPCSSCEIFKDCYHNMNRCWAEVVKAYGDENWDYPDPRCSLAPEMINDLNF